MRNFLIRWLLAAVAVWAASRVVPGIEVETVWAALLAAVALGLLGTVARPVVFILKILTFPITVLTLGLSALVLAFLINALGFYLVGHYGIIPGFHVASGSAALLGALIVSVLNAIFGGIFRRGDANE
jgi:putative membrane protein